MPPRAPDLSRAPRAPLPRLAAPTSVLVAALAIGACGGGGGGGARTLEPGDAPNPVPTGRFELFAGDVGTLVEGAPDALHVPLGLVRGGGEPGTVTLALEGATPADADGLEASFDDAELDAGEDGTGLLLRLAVGDLPIERHVRRLTLVATGPSGVDRLGFDVDVEPTDAPDVYLLIGQSNMVGFSGEGTREPDGADASDPRILQLNVTPNEATGDAAPFRSAAAYADRASNVAAPVLAVAQDPLHQPVPTGFADDGTAASKGGRYIGLGLSFARRAAGRTGANVVLVPAAWSGSSFCANPDGPPGQWNAGPVDDPALGNTWLFDRAVARTDAALAESGGVLRGILWHQGESDANETCAASYAANLDRLVRGLRTRIAPDRRGAALRAPDANIPFVAGTLSRGVDERGDLSTFGAPKARIDDALRALPSRVPHTGVSVHDDLVPAAGFACGNESCIHFGARALREMGPRYDEALLRAAVPTAVPTAADAVAPVE